MPPQKSNFPSWSAPWVGAVAVGFVIGLALWLRDRKRGD